MNLFPHLTPADKLMIKTILVIAAIAVIMILSSCSVYPERMIVVSHHFKVVENDTISYVTQLNQKDTILWQGYLKPSDTTLLKKISTPEKIMYVKSMVNNY